MSNSPEKIFTEANLPILKITDVTVTGTVKDRNRTFHYNGKRLFSPEIVAVVYLEELGHQCCWNEGVALKIALDTLGRFFRKKMIGLFSIDEKKQEVMIDHAQNKDTIDKFYKAISLLNSGEVVIEGVEYEDITERLKFVSTRDTGLSREEQINISSKKATMIREALGDKLEILYQQYLNTKNRTGTSRDALITVRHEALLTKEINKQKEEFNSGLLCLDILGKCLAQYENEESFNPFDNIAAPKHTNNEIRETYKQLMVDLASNTTILVDHIVMPEKDGDKTNPTNKFLNEHTYQFAKKILHSCSLDYLCSLYQKSFLSRWDLTVIDKDTHLLRFIEVKYKDDMTEYQIRRMPEDLENGFKPELCLIAPST